MKFSQAKPGRIFVLRLEHGEIIHREIENFAQEQQIKAASLIVLGGAAEGSKLVVGPERGCELPASPITRVLEEVHEVTGTGTLFPDEDGHPILHMHMACGRKDCSVTGCIRAGVKVWQTMEVVIYELLDSACRRILDKDLGFKLLQIKTEMQ